MKKYLGMFMLLISLFALSGQPVLAEEISESVKNSDNIMVMSGNDLEGGGGYQTDYRTETEYSDWRYLRTESRRYENETTGTSTMTMSEYRSFSGEAGIDIVSVVEVGGGAEGGSSSETMVSVTFRRTESYIQYWEVYERTVSEYTVCYVLKNSSWNEEWRRLDNQWTETKTGDSWTEAD